jgi:hypothetical protein
LMCALSGTLGNGDTMIVLTVPERVVVAFWLIVFIG